MSIVDIFWIILSVFFIIDVTGSIVLMILTYLDKKKQLNYLRHIIRMKECENIEK